MSKRKYCIASFPTTSMKNSLATLSEHVLETIDDIFEILQIHSNESHEQSPWRIFCNMMQNNDSIFGQGVSNIISSAATSIEEKSSPKSTSPLKLQKLPFVDRTNEDLVPKNLETKSTLGEKEKIPSSPVEDDKMDTETSEDVGMKMNPKDENKESIESKKDIIHLMRRNSAGVKSVTVIRHAGFISVEVDIDIDSDNINDESMPKTSEQEYSPSKKVTSPGKSEIKIKSQSGSPSKNEKLTDTQLSSSETFSVVYSNADVLNFLAERLVSTFKSRKTCMQKIGNYFKNFLNDAMVFSNTINDINFVVENLPVAREPYFNHDFLKLREDLIDKALEMSEKAGSFLDGVKEDVNVLENCLNKMDTFEKHNAAFFSSKGASKQTVTDLQSLETHLKEIFTEADSATIITDDRKIILLKSLSDFKWLVNHFVKFLIITGILKPDTSESPQI